MWTNLLPFCVSNSKSFGMEYDFRICFRTHNVEKFTEGSPVWTRRYIYILYLYFSHEFVTKFWHEKFNVVLLFLKLISQDELDLATPFKSQRTKDQKSRLWKLAGFGCQSHSAVSSSKAQWGFVTYTSQVSRDLM